MTGQDPDSGATVLVTGPTRGLGREVVRALCGRDRSLHLVLMGHDGTRMASVRAEAAPAVASVTVAACDFASLAAVRAACAHVRGLVADGHIPPVRAVVANAAVHTIDRCHRTNDGFELTFGVNVLANYLLVHEMLRALAPRARVVLVGSGTHRSDRRKGLVELPRWEDPHDLARPCAGTAARSAVAGQRAYSTSKLAVNYLCHEITRRYPAAIDCNVFDPGLMPGTGLARHMPAWRRFAWERVMPTLRLGASTPERSAAHLADLALGRAFANLRGGYVAVGKATMPSGESFDPARERALWNACRELTQSQ